MWILVQEPKADSELNSDQILHKAENKWGLVAGQVYKVGRLDADIICQSDTSVSKAHAKISVVSRPSQGRPEVLLEDVGSKYGTHLNDGILAESQRLAANGQAVSRALTKPQILKDSDRIRFGVAYSIFRLKWMDYEVTSSMIRVASEKNNLGIWLEDVQPGTKVEPNMSEKTSHLVMSSISLSLKVVNCLATGVPIVTPQFFRDLSTCLKTRQKIPCEDDYIPSVSTNDTESQLRDPAISFKINPNRSKLFSGKLVIFFDMKQFTQNSTPCKLAGGNTKLWSEVDNVKSITKSNIVITPPSKMSQSGDGVWTQVLSRLTSLAVSSCPHTDIYLAIVHCSIQHYCNPAKKSKVLSEVSNNANNLKAPTKDHSILAPESCTYPTPSSTYDKSLNSRVQVSETLSARGSNNSAKDNLGETQVIVPSTGSGNLAKDNIGETQVIVPVTGDTQILVANTSTGNNFKRLRSSTDDNDITEKPPTKQLIVSDYTEKLGKSKIETPVSQNMFESSSNSGVGTASAVKEKPCQWNKFSTNSDNIDDEDDEDDDMFGFGSLKNKKKRKASPEKSQSSQRDKRPKGNDDEDMFGFGEITKKKEQKRTFNVEDSSPQEVGRDKQIKPDEEIKKDDNEIKKEYIEVDEPSSPKPVCKITLDVTGFIGKLDIKGEVKDETGEITTGETSLNSTFVKITSVSMMRPKIPKPHFIQHPDPEKLGKPVVNFKKFKKQQFEKRNPIPLVEYDPGKSNESAIDAWFRDNQDVTLREQEAEQLNKQSEDFWEFDTKTNNKKKTYNRR